MASTSQAVSTDYTTSPLPTAFTATSPTAGEPVKPARHLAPHSDKPIFPALERPDSCGEPRDGFVEMIIGAHPSSARSAPLPVQSEAKCATKPSPMAQEAPLASAPLDSAKSECVKSKSWWRRRMDSLNERMRLSKELKDLAVKCGDA